MADWGSVVVQYPGVVFLGGTRTQDVTFVGYTTSPSGVYFEVGIPQTIYDAQQVTDYGIGYSGTIEAVLAIPGVVGGEWTQTPTPGGELTSNLVVYVTTPSGNSQSSLAIPFSKLSPEMAKPLIDALISKLVAGENV